MRTDGLPAGRSTCFTMASSRLAGWLPRPAPGFVSCSGRCAAARGRRRAGLRCSSSRGPLRWQARWSAAVRAARHLYLVRPLEAPAAVAAAASEGVTCRPIVSSELAASSVWLRRPTPARPRHHVSLPTAGWTSGRTTSPNSSTRLSRLVPSESQFRGLPGRPPQSGWRGLRNRVISKRTAHIAQVVVDPRARRRGLGRLLVERSLAAAAAAATAE